MELPVEALPQLPVLDALDELQRALAERGTAVLSAPPGSGKTTLLPLALMDAPWLRGKKILLLEPRRVAARAAARRMAALLGEKPGQRVGYQVRGERQVGANTRIEVVTEGLLTRRLQADPELPGVGLLIFDEFHERSLDVDLALALALQARETLRPDLRLLVMSATLDAEALLQLMAADGLIEAKGQQYPVSSVQLGGGGPREIVTSALRGVSQALARSDGDVLVFLPGAPEIHRLAGELQRAGCEAQLHPLYGALSAAEQDAALRPAAPGQRKVILATNLAQTSLTVEGVTAVVDSGYERQAVFDLGAAANRLDTVRISRAAATQRAGRAGRLAPGIALQLWSAEQAMVAHDTPEILRADLTRFALELAAWGCAPEQLALLNQPPPANWQLAQQALGQLNAVDAEGRITPLGRKMLSLPMHPRLARMVLQAQARGLGETAAWLAAALGVPGANRQTDLTAELQAARRDRHGPIAREAGLILKRLAAADDWQPQALGGLVATAFPERVARLRRGSSNTYHCADGGEALLPAGAHADAQWLAIAHWQASEPRQIRSAARVERAELEDILAGQLQERRQAKLDPDSGLIRAEQGRFLGAVAFFSRSEAATDEEAAPLLLAHIRKRGLVALGWTAEDRQLQARVQSLRRWCPATGLPDLGDAALLETLELWLQPYLAGIRKLGDLTAVALEPALRAQLSHAQVRELDALAPARLRVPSGSNLLLDYQADGGSPVLAVRLQEMLGCAQTPKVAGGELPISLHLLSPARRPIQVTQDLVGFWSGSYAEVRKEMRGRYPRHPWPEDPLSAAPTRKAKPRKP